MNVMEKTKSASLYPLAYSIVSIQSLMVHAKAFGKRPVIQFEKTHNGQNILALALYEKGTLRPDILNLSNTAKQ